MSICVQLEGSCKAPLWSAEEESCAGVSQGKTEEELVSLVLPCTTASRDGQCLSETGSQLTMNLVSLASTRLGNEEREKQERSSQFHPSNNL